MGLNGNYIIIINNYVLQNKNIIFWIYIYIIDLIEKEELKEKFKQIFDFPNDQLMYEDIFEWNIENWKDLAYEVSSKTFKICGLNW